MFAIIGQKIQVRLNDTAAFTTANGDSKVFPVIINQTTTYPATIYEIVDVDNFMSKSNSLNSCNVTIRLSCFSKSYATTYNQAKAAVEALDLYSVDYTEDSVDYTAKFSFSSLSDEYHNVAEVYYKDIIFNCLIIRT
jgi:hypothetical protein